MTLGPPTDFGAPSAFSSWRRGQDVAFSTLLNDRRRFQCLNLPAGAGKTGVGMTYALFEDKPKSLYLTATKGLQQQLGDDGWPGLLDIRGMSNYECLEEGGTCDVASCTDGVTCHRKAGGCLYFDAVRRAREGRRVSSNYAWWMTQHAVHQPFGDVDLMIADEAHQLETEVSRYLSVWLGDREVEWGAGAITRSHADWRDWAEVSARAIRLGAARNRWEKKKLRDLKDRLTKLTLMSDDWIVERKAAGWSFDPLWPAKYMEEWVWRGAKKIVLMSATLRPKTLEIIGVKDAHFAEYDSPIPVNNRLVYYLPVARWTYRASDLDVWKIGAKADAIIEGRLDRKGLLQPVSYARGLAMKEQSRFADIMLVHDKDNAQEVIAKFKAMAPPAVLVSPIIHTGYDFTAPAARYNIIPKVPFQPPSLLLKARTVEDKTYPYYLAMMGMVQAIGRVGRRVEDRVESFVLDEQAGWLMSKYGVFAPRYFHKAWRRVDQIPKPPPLGAE